MADVGRLTILTALVCLLSTSYAHSWIEEVALISSNGSLIGPRGYARNNGKLQCGSFDCSERIPSSHSGADVVQ